MASTRPTEKQKEKLCNSEMFRSNSSDLTVNPSFQNDVSYDGDGNLHFDGRTKVGKEINRIMKSRNRSSNNQIDNYYYDKSPKYKNQEEYIDDDNTVPWEYQKPENYWSYVLGPNHDEDDEGVADLYED